MFHRQTLSPLIDKSTLYKEKRQSSPAKHSSDIRKQNISHMMTILKEKRAPSRLNRKKHSRKGSARSILTDNIFNSILQDSHLPPEDIIRAESPTRNMLLINSFLPNYSFEKSLIFWPENFSSTQYNWSSRSRANDRQPSVPKNAHSESPCKFRNNIFDKPFSAKRKNSLKALESAKNGQQLLDKDCNFRINPQNSHVRISSACVSGVSNGIRVKGNMYKPGPVQNTRLEAQLRGRRQTELKQRKNEEEEEEWNMLSGW
jgi:hypothetical protein